MIWTLSANAASPSKRAVTLNYTHTNGEKYQLNLIDTPGHVDFTYEVTRSLQACEGALLLVDSAQGVEAQTVANFSPGLDQDLEIVPVLNKIDLPAARPDEVAMEVEESLALDASDCIQSSAKKGIGVPEILAAVVERMPAPEGDPNGPLQALDF